MTLHPLPSATTSQPATATSVTVQTVSHLLDCLLHCTGGDPATVAAGNCSGIARNRTHDTRDNHPFSPIPRLVLSSPVTPTAARSDHAARRNAPGAAHGRRILLRRRRAFVCLFAAADPRPRTPSIDRFGSANRCRDPTPGRRRTG
jgi:hypothetical protein